MLTIDENNLASFLDKIKKQYVFFDCRNDTLPPKQYFFPPKEVLFIENKKTDSVATPPDAPPFVLFGLSFNDLEAISFLDEIMKKGARDYYYFSRRNKSLLIGVTEDDFKVPHVGDVVLRKLKKNGRYEVVAVTKKGKTIVKDFMHTKEENDNGDQHKHSHKKTMPKLEELLLDSELLKDAVSWSRTGMPRLWSGLEKKCIGCGVCTYVCPLCHCFSVEDQTDLSGNICSRCRLWSACTLPEFSRVAGGHYFHKGQKDRYYNWFYHKFVRSYFEFGKAQCVACGECKKQCPAKIDIEKVLLKIVTAYKKAKKIQ